MISRLWRQVWPPALEAEPVPHNLVLTALRWLLVAMLFLYIYINRADVMGAPMFAAAVLVPAYLVVMRILAWRARGSREAQLRVWAIEGFGSVTVILLVAAADNSPISPVPLISVAMVTTVALMFRAGYVILLGVYAGVGTITARIIAVGPTEANLGVLTFVGVVIVVVAAYSAYRTMEEERLRINLADLNNRMAMRQALVEQQRQLRSLLDNVPVALFAIDGEGRLAITPGQAVLSSVPAIASLNGLHYSDLPEPPAEYPAVIDRLLTRGEPIDQQLDWQGRSFQVVGTPIVDRGNIDGAVGILVDQTERQDLERQLVQSQRLESLGRLAGGIAHDFNNILTVITGYGDLALLKIDESHEIYADIDEMRMAAHRAQSLTRQLLSFSRSRAMKPKPSNLSTVVERVHGMLTPIVGEQIELRMSLEPDLPSAMIDPGQVEQVIMNLVVNACDAISREGAVEITTTSRGEGEERQVVLSVRDTGAGMERAVVDRIFEPFFTTKGAGRGTGLGLATVYGIITQARGSITVDSTLGVGTVFTISLPAIDAIEELPILAPAETTEFTGGRAVVCEDDPSLLNFVAEALRAAGFEVETAANGVEALSLLRRLGHQTDIVVTDVVMPRMGGIELAGWVAAEWPQVALMLMSGYPGDTEQAEAITRSQSVFLEKPFSRDQLLAAVQRARQLKRQERVAFAA